MNEENTYIRPWGSYQILKQQDNCLVKWITIKPYQKLSLQRHLKRSESWIVAKGSPIITISTTAKKYHQNDLIYIPKNCIHRIANETSDDVIIVEVQIGSYLKEDDIIRIEDAYGRV